MKELKYLNKYLYKYRSKLLFGIFITIIARIFSLIAPRLIGKSMNAVEDFIKNKENLDIENLQKTLLIYISIIIGLIWLLFTIIFEFLFGYYAMGNSWNKLLSDYNILEGKVWVFVLIWIAIAPYIIYQIQLVILNKN